MGDFIEIDDSMVDNFYSFDGGKTINNNMTISNVNNNQIPRTQHRDFEMEIDFHSKDNEFIDFHSKDNEFIHQKMTENNDLKMTENHDNQTAQNPEPNSSKSKNSIFEMDWKISKPITAMNQKEIHEYKRSLVQAPICNSPSDQNTTYTRIQNIYDFKKDNINNYISGNLPPLVKNESMTIMTCNNDSSFTKSQHREMNDAMEIITADKPSFLQMTAPVPELFRKQSSLSLIGLPNLDRLSLAPTISLPNQSQTNTPRDPIYLHFMPLAKNKIGEGLYSTVYRGEFESPSLPSSSSQMTCCIKKVADNAEAYTLAQTETYILYHLSQLSHPSIVTFIDTKDEKDLSNHTVLDSILKGFDSELECYYPPPLPCPSPTRFLIVLEYCSNGNIWDWMERHPNSVGQKLWLKWTRQIIQGIEAIHSLGIIHHDMKPHNILLTSVLDVRISDFGSARFVPAALTSPYTSTAQPDQLYLFDDKNSPAKGTLVYTAPELVFSSPLKGYTFSVDWYSIGVTLFTMLTCTPPYGHLTTMQMYMAIQRGFFAFGSQPLVLRWSVPDPTDRQWQFNTGEKCPLVVCDVVEGLVGIDPTCRMSPKKVLELLDLLDS